MKHSDALPRCTPEHQGIPSHVITRFTDAVEERGLELHSFMAVRGAHVIAEGWWAPYDAGRPHMLFSLSKSFTSTAVGLAVDEGLLSLDDKVISFFPEETPEHVSENLAAMTVKHLLMMGTGHHDDPFRALDHAKDNWTRVFLHAPVEHAPGSHFVYNNSATYMAGAIVQKLTGSTLLDYLQPRLFDYLGIPEPTWESCPRGYNCGAWGLSISTESIAKFGLLYLQEGKWQDRQLLPSEWVKEASSKHISNGDDPDHDWNQGYGYQFWLCRNGAYRGDGAFGQFCVIMPEHETVIAITSGTNDLGGVLNTLWDILLPALQQPLSPLEPAPSFFQELQNKLASLSLDPPAYPSSSLFETQYAGITYQFEENKLELIECSFDFASGVVRSTIRNKQGELSGEYGTSGWTEAESSLLQGEPDPAVVHASWKAEDTLVLTLRFVETPFCLTASFTFNENGLELAVSQNVGFADASDPMIIKGTALARSKDEC